MAQVDRRLGLTARLAQCIRDGRQPGKTRFSIHELLAQRVLGLVAGYEDASDHNALRADSALKVAVGRRPNQADLATQPTLCRFENQITARELLHMARAFLSLFVDMHKTMPPRRIVLDFDATDDPTHGQQVLSGFHGYYGCHCFVPLVITAQCDDGPQEPLLAILRPGKSHASRGAAAILRRILQVIQSAFPGTAVLFRGDSGFALPELYDLCEDHHIEFAIGLPKNHRLKARAQPFVDQAYTRFFSTGQTTQVFGDFLYQAETWRHPRRVIVKTEIIASHRDDPNIRFVVTNDMHRSPEALYQSYRQRGDMESRIDELKNDCFSGRTSCHRFEVNQLRLFMALAAYWLFARFRMGLADPKLRVAQVETLRTRLVKVAARVVETVRRVTFSFPSHYPFKNAWLDAANWTGVML